MRRDLVLAFLRRCSDLDRRIVRWAVLARLPDDEIAARLGRPVALIHRRRQRLLSEMRAVGAAV